MEIFAGQDGEVISLTAAGHFGHLAHGIVFGGNSRRVGFAASRVFHFLLKGAHVSLREGIVVGKLLKLLVHTQQLAYNFSHVAQGAFLLFRVTGFYSREAGQ